MAGMGALPKPEGQRRRRNAAPGTVVLPAAGRVGPVPVWPLAKPTKAQTERWALVWRKPQAVEWERKHEELVVARYVCKALLAERANAKGPVMTETRQLEDRLGLSDVAMLRLRWVI